MNRKTTEVYDTRLQSTPRRKNKTSKQDHNTDVHSFTGSTPMAHHSPQISFRGLESPSSSFPCSQDNRPDVIWDYTSPKPANGVRKKELKLTVKEFLETWKHSDESKSTVQSTHIRLLENWMANQNRNVPVKKKIQKVKQNKNKSREAMEKLKLFLDSIQMSNDAVESGRSPRLQNNCDTKQSPVGVHATPKINKAKNCFLDGNSTDGDSADEIWGHDLDNSFLIKATQEIESSITDKNVGSQSTIPETNPSSSCEISEWALPQMDFLAGNNTSKKSPHAGITMTTDKYAELLTQLTNIDWDSDLESDCWENGFIEDKVQDSIVDRTSEKTIEESTVTHENGRIDDRCSNFGDTAVKMSSDKLFGEFEDDSFEDDPLFFQDDVLTQIDEIESRHSQRPRCSPQEIERKKCEALKKRKKR